MNHNRTLCILKEVSSSIAGYISVLWIAVHYNSKEKLATLQSSNQEILGKLYLADNPELVRKYLHLLASAEDFYNELSQEIRKRE